MCLATLFCLFARTWTDAQRSERWVPFALGHERKFLYLSLSLSFARCFCARHEQLSSHTFSAYNSYPLASDISEQRERKRGRELSFSFLSAGLLPHSPLHVRSLADFERKVMSDGSVREVVTSVRETRLAAIFCHILIGISAMFVPWIFSYLPVPVLDGNYIYVFYWNNFYLFSQETLSWHHFQCKIT